MSKISLEEIEHTLSNQKLDKTIITKVITELTKKIEELKEDREPAPKTKNEFVIVLSDPAEELKGKEFVGWLVSKPTGDDSGLILDKIRTAARETDEAKRRKKNTKMTTFADAFAGIKRKFIKDKNILIKTKESCRVLITNNKL